MKSTLKTNETFYQLGGGGGGGYIKLMKINNKN